MSSGILQKFRPYHIAGLKRLGNKYDGGYIVHYASLKDAEYLINYGVGYNVEFEKDFFNETGKPTLAFDPTLRDLKPIFSKLFKGQLIPFLRHAKNYVAWTFKALSLPKYHIKFIPEGIYDKDIEGYKTFAYHFNKYKLADKKFIFKLDVEGAEYPVFKDGSIYPLLSNAVQIYMELHDLDKRIEDVAAIITALEPTHTLVHIHANNHAPEFAYEGKKVPETIEVTFVHNDYLPVKEHSTEKYPIAGLDNPCDRLKADTPMDFFY